MQKGPSIIKFKWWTRNFRECEQSK